MLFAEQPILTTERLTLRPLQCADAEDVFEIFSDPEVMRYWSSSPMQGVQDAVASINRDRDFASEGSSYRWGVVRNEDGKTLGTVTVHQISEGNRRCELGYCLGLAHWGRGYMHEALVAMVGMLFATCDLHRIEADIDPRNDNSRRSLERLGFRHEGTLRERWIVAGEVSDTGFYGLLRSEWDAIDAH